MDWVGLLPRFECWTKVEKEPPFEDFSKAFLPLRFSLEPFCYGRGVVQTILVGCNCCCFGLYPESARETIQLRLISSPERCLIATPGCGDGDDSQYKSLNNLQ